MTIQGQTYPLSLLRTGAIAIVVALIGNVLLWPITEDDDWFANTIAVASVVVGLAIIVCYFVAEVRHLLDTAFLASMAIWLANTLEVTTQPGLPWEVAWRQAAFYIGFGVASLGLFLSVHLALRETQTAPVPEPEL